MNAYDGFIVFFNRQMTMFKRYQSCYVLKKVIGNFCNLFAASMSLYEREETGCPSVTGQFREVVPADRSAHLVHSKALLPFADPLRVERPDNRRM